ncbi:hypothetical protein B484DRAFT_441784 [Ochromonadaceae sp. CCMP2298]|nr:hypothetical protein B484DRAFT_441784 [Ochromonadaceae sp. CCMP2298]
MLSSIRLLQVGGKIYNGNIPMFLCGYSQVPDVPHVPLFYIHPIPGTLGPYVTNYRGAFL